MVADLLSPRSSLAAFQTTEALWSGEYFTIVIDLVYIDTAKLPYDKNL